MFSLRKVGIVLSLIGIVVCTILIIIGVYNGELSKPTCEEVNQRQQLELDYLEETVRKQGVELKSCQN